VQICSSIAKLLNKCAALITEDQYERERSRLPESRVGAIRVYGPASFVSDVPEALGQLERCYPYGYSLVQRNVRDIIHTDIRRRNGEPIRVVFVRSSREGRLPLPPSRSAANLVRHAVVWRKQFGFGLFRSRKSQVQSISRELHAMRLLGCDQKYFHRPTNLILSLERKQIQASPAAKPPPR
jgi:hypothetical protein